HRDGVQPDRRRAAGRPRREVAAAMTNIWESEAATKAEQRGASVENILEVTDLSTHIEQSRSTVQAVGGVSFHLRPGETLGLVGESGCGKSMTGQSIMDSLHRGGRIFAGSVKLNGRELVGLADHEMRRIRGNEIAMVFQDPMT